MNFVHTGDSASLYNYTLSPGWTREEVEVLRLALIKFGTGKWTEISESGCLPGKTPAQACLQTQRLLGQQSTAEFMGLHIDPNDIRAENIKKTDAVRKNGYIINSGNKIRRDQVKELQQKNKEKYEISYEEYSKIVLPMPGDQKNKEEAFESDVSSCTPCTSDDDDEEDEDEDINDQSNNNKDETTMTTTANESDLTEKELEVELGELFDQLKVLRKEREFIKEKLQKQQQITDQSLAERDSRFLSQPQIIKVKAIKNKNKRSLKDEGEDEHDNDHKNKENNNNNNNNNTPKGNKKKVKISDSDTLLFSSSSKKKKKINNYSNSNSNNKNSSSQKKMKQSTLQSSTTAKQKNGKKKSKEIDDSDKEEVDVTENTETARETCICFKEIKEGDFWLACDKCGDWFHGSCVDVREEDAEALEWFCQPCQ